MWGDRRIAAALAALLLVASALDAAPRRRGAARGVAPGPCALEWSAPRQVVRVTGSDQLVLDDGREVVLIGALGPRAIDVGAEPGTWPPEEDARAALTELAVGQTVVLGTMGGAEDRYGRLLAHVMLVRGEERVWLQGQMLAAGHARVYAIDGQTACLPQMLEHERIGREAALGVWRSPAYRLGAAWRVGDLLRRAGTFQVVEGRLVQVAAVRGRFYLNFGADWRTDFTAELTGGVRAGGESAARLKALQGRTVRVRGWIGRRNGPFVDLPDAALVEAVGADPIPSAGTPAAETATAPPDAAAR